MRRASALSLALASAILFGGWTAFHMEVVDSFPEADQVVSGAPTEIWLEFSVEPEMERTSFSVRGPGGGVALGDITAGDSPAILRAEVIGPMPPGVYTVSWVGASLDDHAVRGRFSFTMGTAR